MTVSTTTSRADYTGNGVTTTFTVPFYFLDNTHLVVYRTQISTGVVTTLALTTNYTVSGAGVAAGGSITCLVAPTSDQKISILRNVPFTQLTDYVANDPFPAESHEQALDKLTMEVQQVNEVTSRALTLAANTTGVSASLPTPSANNFLAWNASAAALVNVSPADVVTIAGSSGFSTQSFSGNASTTVFTLTANPGAISNLEVFISGVRQRPTTDYTVSGTTLTFVSAPPTGTNNIFVRWGQTLGIGVPSDTSVSTVKIVDANVTTAKIADANVTTAKIADANVTTAKIADANVTTGKIADSAITTAKIAAGAVIPASMANAGYELGLRNRIINGAMVIDQRNAGASVTPIEGQYTLDRWVGRVSAASKYSVQQNAGGVTPPTGYTNYLGVTSLSAYSLGASDFFGIQQSIEGFNIADLGWGAAGGFSATLSFWVRSSLTGTFGVSLYNNSGSVSIPFTYSIPTANTWQYVTIAIPSSSLTGTFGSTTNGLGISVFFNLGCGTSQSGGTPGTWSTTFARAPSGAVSVVGTNGATFYITGVQLERGSTATPFEYRSYGAELALCQRYYYRKNAAASSEAIASLQVYSTQGCYGKILDLPVQMRATPTSSYSTIGHFSLNSATAANQYPCTSNAGFQASPNSIYSQNSIVASTASLTIGNCTVFQFNTTSGWFDASAEL